MKSNSIFVFGSNEKGIHRSGAALAALNNHGAIFGQGEGRQGNCYAIPTKKDPSRSLSIVYVMEYVNIFLEYARANPELDFQVTKIGTGLAGFLDWQMASLFDSAPENCYFDEGWRPFLDDGFKYWGEFNG